MDNLESILEESEDIDKSIRIIGQGTLTASQEEDNYLLKVYTDTGGVSRRRSHTSREENIKIVLSTYNKKRQWPLLILMGSVEFFYSLIMLSQGIFYPREAHDKGVSASIFGLVFGLYDLTMFIVAPCMGLLIGKTGPKVVYISGAFLSGFSAIAFGMLHYVQDSTLFVGLSFFLRILEGIGDGAYITASFTIISMEFSNSLGTTFASMQSIFGFGYIVGPFIVSNLFKIGNFALPFVVVGSCLIIIGALALIFLQNSERDSNEILKPQTSIFKVLTIPEVGLDAFSIIPAAISIGFLEATLSPHITQFNLDPTYASIIYGITGGVYAITAPIFGYICDNIKHQKYITLIGSILIIIGFSLLGPVPLPFFPTNPTILLCSLGLCIHGIGMGATCVSAFLQGLQDSLDNGLPNNVATFALISGLWKSMFSFGNFIGPSIAGFLYDSVGFRYETLFVIGLELILAFAVLSYIIIMYFPKKSKLLENSTVNYGTIS